MLYKITHYFTTINWLLLLSLVWIHHPLYLDIIRATTMFCFAGIVSVWFSGRITEVYHSIFRAFFPPIDTHAEFFIMFCGDMLLHVFPFIILGFPLLPISILIALGILLAWYVSVRPQLHHIYTSSINGDIIISMVCLFSALAMIRI